MESDNENISEESFEFSAEELEEAIKRKPGRPSNRTRELRENIKDAKRLTSILGILDSGILEQFSERFGGGFSESVPQGSVRVDKEPSVVSDGFTEELLLNLGLINKKFATTNKNILGLTDDVVSNALIKYGPLVTALAGVWIAEGQVKDFPQTLHTTIAILTKLLRLIDILGSFIGDGLGGITDFIKDPIDTIRVGLGGARMNDIRNINNLPPEDHERWKAAFIQTTLGIQIASLTPEQQLEIFGVVVFGVGM